MEPELALVLVGRKPRCGLRPQGMETMVEAPKPASYDAWDSYDTQLRRMRARDTAEVP